MLRLTVGVHRGTCSGHVLLGKSADAVRHEYRIVVCERRRNKTLSMPTVREKAQKGALLTAVSAMSFLIRFVTLALVLVVLDAVFGQAVEDELLVARRLTLNPTLHVRSHEVLHLGRAVDKVRVVEGLKDCGCALTEGQAELARNGQKADALCEATAFGSIDDSSHALTIMLTAYLRMMIAT